jgi:hypothetical protein
MMARRGSLIRAEARVARLSLRLLRGRGAGWVAEAAVAGVRR